MDVLLLEKVKEVAEGIFRGQIAGPLRFAGAGDGTFYAWEEIDPADFPSRWFWGYVSPGCDECHFWMWEVLEMTDEQRAIYDAIAADWLRTLDAAEVARVLLVDEGQYPEVFLPITAPYIGGFIQPGMEPVWCNLGALLSYNHFAPELHVNEKGEWRVFAYRIPAVQPVYV